MKSIILLYSYHHNNTEKLAHVFSKVLDAPIRKTGDITPEELSEYDLVGFGSGIYSDKHHPSMLEFVDKLPEESGKKAFLFSTAGISNKTKTRTDHSHIRDKLESKGYTVVDEYQCVGFNTNSFLKYLGGMNKGRPNTKDLQEVEAVAQKMKTLS
jgi:flavodoxin